MNKRDLGLEITDVPGVEYVRTEPNGGSYGNVHVVIKFQSMKEEMSYGLTEVEELIQALMAAHERARDMAVYE